MAGNPRTTLTFEGNCPDCGRRQVDLPAALPVIGDDFDWRVRDYDGFRLFMLEELLARFPERSRWTPADLEVVLVEVLAAALDQLSDMADRVAGEAFLETARRPESVRRLLKLIGYDAVRAAGLADDPTELTTARSAVDKLEALWLQEPHSMDAARQAGPRAIHTQHRMVTAEDYAERLEDHPLVLRAHAWSAWSGSWTSIHIAVIAWNNLALDVALPVVVPGDLLAESLDALKRRVNLFHQQRGLPAPYAALGDNPAIRTVLRRYAHAYRMAGQEVLLQDAEVLGISMAVSVRVAEHYFQSEIRYAIDQALGTGVGGFFEPGRLRFGEDLHASDILETLMALDGVETVCLNRFKRVGRRFPDQSDAGLIVLDGLQVAVCDNDPMRPERGYYSLMLHGGRKG